MGKPPLFELEYYLYKFKSNPNHDPKHAAFIDTLPKDFSEFPTHFSKADLKILKNTHALVKMNIHTKPLKGYYNNTIRTFFTEDELSYK